MFIEKYQFHSDDIDGFFFLVWRHGSGHCSLNWLIRMWKILIIAIELCFNSISCKFLYQNSSKNPKIYTSVSFTFTQFSSTFTEKRKKSHQMNSILICCWLLISTHTMLWNDFESSGQIYNCSTADYPYRMLQINK